MIDATLQYLGILHEYETPLRIAGQTIHPDFSLGHGIYIEYWGLQTKQYLHHKKMKQKLYKRGKYQLINIENEDLKNILSILTRHLVPYEKLFPTLHNILVLKKT